MRADLIGRRERADVALAISVVVCSNAGIAGGVCFPGRASHADPLD